MKAPTLKSLTPTRNQRRHPRGWARRGGPGPAGPSSPTSFPARSGGGAVFVLPGPTAGQRSRAERPAGTPRQAAPSAATPAPSATAAASRATCPPSPARARPGPRRRERHRPPTVSAARPARVPAADRGRAPRVAGPAGLSARPALTLRSAASALPCPRGPSCGSRASPARRPHSRRRGAVSVSPAHLVALHTWRWRSQAARGSALTHTPRLFAPQELPAFSLLSSRIPSRKHTGRGSFGPSEAFSGQNARLLRTWF